MLSIHLQLLLIIFSGKFFVVRNADVNNAVFDNTTIDANEIEENEIVAWTPQYQNAKEIAEHGPKEKIYFATDATCGVINLLLN